MLSPSAHMTPFDANFPGNTDKRTRRCTHNSLFSANPYIPVPHNAMGDDNENTPNFQSGVHVMTGKRDHVDKISNTANSLLDREKDMCRFQYSCIQILSQ